MQPTEIQETESLTLSLVWEGWQNYWTDIIKEAQKEESEKN